MEQDAGMDSAVLSVHLEKHLRVGRTSHVYPDGRGTMKKLGLLLVAAMTLSALAGCATAQDYCSNPENAKAYGGYDNCVKARQPREHGTY